MSEDQSQNQKEAPLVDGDTGFWKKVALVVEELENKKVNVGQCARVSDDDDHIPLLEELKSEKVNVGQCVRVSDDHIPLVEELENKKVKVGQCVRVSDYHIPLLEELNNKKVNVGQCVRVSDDHIPLVEELKNKKVNFGQCVRVSDDTTVFSPLKGDNVSALDRIHLGSENSENEMRETPVVDGGEEDKNGSSGLLVDSNHSFSMERCSNLSADVASLHSCSCTFCTQVAYIWSDLHYKDVKDRVSVSVKSQKDASDLAQRYILQTEMSRLSHKTHDNVEPDLTTQWKSLFLHLENVFGTETSLLQADLQCLRSIRDDFKTNLEMINAIPVDVHPCSSNSSDHVMI